MVLSVEQRYFPCPLVHSYSHPSFSINWILKREKRRGGGSSRTKLCPPHFPFHLWSFQGFQKPALTCKFFKWCVRFQGEAFAVLIEGLVLHLSALVNGGLCYCFYCNWNIPTPSHLRKMKSAMQFLGLFLLSYVLASTRLVCDELAYYSYQKQADRHVWTFTSGIYQTIASFFKY